MTNLGKIAAAVGSLVVAMAGIYFLTQQSYFLSQPGPNTGNAPAASQGQSGIDVGNTPCEGIAAARSAVDEEYNSRIEKADSGYRAAMEAASDNYWEKYNQAEQTKVECESDALVADPCREHFERASALAKEILDNIDEGYDEAKSTERDQAKEDYDDCMKNPPEEDTYEGKNAKCAADFSAKVVAAQAERDGAEAAAEAARDAAKARAEEGKTSKHATLDAIAEICNIPPPKTEVTAGGITTGGTGTVVEAGNPACSGSFSGYDEEIQSEIDRLRSLMEQARAGGKEEGWGGALEYSAKINELREQMADGPKKCSADSDCGDTTKVCCSDSQVGWVACSDGVCGTETEDCGEDEVCAGKPASCVAGSEGAESSAIEISRVFIKGATCNPNLQNISLQPKDENSDRFEIAGAIPAWLKFSQVGGQLPQDILVSIDCNITKTEGTYTGEASITVYDQDNNLINTIPLIVSIEVTPSILEEDEDAISVGEDIDLEDPGEATTNDPGEVVMPADDEEALSTGNEVELEPIEEVTPVTVPAANFPAGAITLDQLMEYSAEECDCCDEAHWHAKAGFGITSNGETINDPYSGCGLGKVSENPVVEIESE